MLAEADQIAVVAQLGDEELIERLTRLLARERGVHTQLLIHVAEVDARGLYRERAYSSMFEYCVQALHMSEAEAYLRIRVARLGREYPRIWHMLETGELHLSGLKLLAPELNANNADELLEAARGKSKRELERLLAARFQKPDVSVVIRKLPDRAPACAVNAAMPLALGSGPEMLTLKRERSAAIPSATPSPEPRRAALQPPVSANARATLAPLSPGRYKVQFTSSQQLHDKLRQARDIMRHELPDGDLAQIVERALDLLIADRMKRRFGVGRKPRAGKQKARKAKAKAASRHIPRSVSRDVVARDGGQCSFVSPEGRRCTEHGWLELHHEQPFGRGGPGSTGNIRLLCRSHNRLLAERDYGRDVIQQRIEHARNKHAAQRLAPESPRPAPAS